MLKSAWIINLWLKQTRNRIALPTFIPWIFYLDLLIVRTAWNKLKQITVLCSQDYTDKAEYIRKAGGYFPPHPNYPPLKPYSFTCLGLKAFCGDVWNLLLFHARLTHRHTHTQWAEIGLDTFSSCWASGISQPSALAKTCRDFLSLFTLLAVMPDRDIR